VNRRNVLKTAGALIVVVLAVGAAAPGAAADGLWVKVTGAYNGLAMDDINNETFRFHDTSIDGYAFPDITGGFGLGFHLGSDVGPNVAFGASWERQHAHVSGTDVSVTAEMKLDADFFMGHVYWDALQGRRLNAGLAAGMGLVAANGVVDVTQGSASYGSNDTSGSSLAFEAMFTASYAVDRDKGLQFTAGWRAAKVGKVKFAGSTAVREDGSDLALDYSGYTLRLGMVWWFEGAGNGAGSVRGVIQ
jgi:hypothetical protein